MVSNFLPTGSGRRATNSPSLGGWFFFGKGTFDRAALAGRAGLVSSLPSAALTDLATLFATLAALPLPVFFTLLALAAISGRDRRLLRLLVPIAVVQPADGARNQRYRDDHDDQLVDLLGDGRIDPTQHEAQQRHRQR